MPEYLSNGVLRELLSHASEDEKLTLTKLLDENQNISYSHERLQEEICLCGGHGVANIVRGQGTGYLDILDDIVEKLKIKGLPRYYGAIDGELSLRDIDDASLIKVPNR